MAAETLLMYQSERTIITIVSVLDRTSRTT